ncbi:MAG: sugar phosphate isomerase/epimerase [Opitutaceae bacterium]|nr:sugar phosphate isomerase/epimerase [Opitutaceae bacterium]
MSFPNPLILFENHFVMHRRHYPMRTRLAVAADIGYDGYELYPMEPDDDRAWTEAESAYRASGLKQLGIYVVAKGVNDDEVAALDAEIDRVKRVCDRLAEIQPGAYLNFTITSNPGQAGVSDYRQAGSACAAPRHWERTQRMLREIDTHLAARGLAGNLYNHIWFIIDTAAAELRALREAEAKVIRPGLAAFHTYFHQGELDFHETLAQPGMEKLGYYAVLNGWREPATPFRSRPLDDGSIDIAANLGLLWAKGYAGPIVSQAYDLGGDAWLTAKRSYDYLRSIHERYQRNPALNPHH